MRSTKEEDFISGFKAAITEYASDSGKSTAKGSQLGGKLLNNQKESQLNKKAEIAFSKHLIKSAFDNYLKNKPVISD
ncbi:hypothetical protein [Photobacterium leiognathi]|uniref:hypothetical protein n=1 Tax=Photobacterium leiognathi TaxID=553611 RepID=UPI00298273DB|nr:hypothetical protein [Photobacterium leiognathi]